jgi:AcrR family transcriptional regulator
MATPQADPRIARTRRMLQTALLDLARDQPLDEITVAEIADRAEVNRSSFYQHYSDKETLLADALDAQAAAVGADLASLDAAAVPGDTAPPELVLRYTRHVFAHAALYRLALGEHGSSIAVARLRNRIAALAMTGYAPVEIAAASVAGSLLGMLTAWLESTDPVPPEQVAVWIWNALARPRC